MTDAITQDMLDHAEWNEATQAWVIYAADGRRVATVAGADLPGSEHPRHYTPAELADALAGEE